jgi:hypothetical protein
MCKFHDIGAFRQCVADVRSVYRYVGRDDAGEPVFDETRPLPVLPFTGTVKLHGTNAAVCTDGSEIWCQSRTSIITPEADNQGFAAWCQALPGRWEALKALLDRALRHPVCVKPEALEVDVALHGEFCGKTINKGVGVCQLPKMFVIFDVAVWHRFPGEDGDVWRPRFLADEEVREFADEGMGVYSIHRFPTFHMDVDFGRAEEFVEPLERVTLQVEARCPVAAQFGVEGLGEGVVWSHNADGDKRFTFKVKGEKHAVVKAPKLVTVDTVQLDSATRFVEYAVTENRLRQGLENIPGLEPRYIGHFVKWVLGDVQKEEADTIAANGIEPKMLSKLVEQRARAYIVKKIKETV